MTLWREWVTGQTPSNAVTMIKVLPPPRVHDHPSPPRTYLGRLCSVQVCQQRDPHATASLRFSPSGLCVACLTRLRGKTTV
jgi:hypothetical protein